jgi:hypothetical protein
MTKMQTAPDAGLTLGERNHIRHEVDMFFATLPTAAVGFQPKI